MATKIVTKNSSTAGAAPTATDLVQGELAVNVADGRLYTEDNAAAIVELGVNPATEITANAGIALPDNQKATFGAGDDLQIYHDGTDSFISDQGTGNLKLLANDFRLANAANNQLMIAGNQDGAVTAYYSGSAKLATTTTGIDVTGTATMDGLSVAAANPDVYITSADTGQADLYFGGTTSPTKGRIQYSDNSDWLRLWANSIKHIELGGNGDISFYEDTGTTPKLFWDASAESLGIGTSSPTSYPVAKNLVVDAGSSGGITIKSGSDHYGGVFFADGITGNEQYRGFVQYNHNHAGSTDSLLLGTAGAERMRIDASGKVGIGESDPSGYWAQANQLVIEDGNCGLTLKSAVSGNGRLVFTDTKSTTSGLNDGGMISYGHTDDAMVVQTAGDERMRIDASGNLLVGTTDNTLYNNTSGSGIMLAASGRIDVARVQDVCAILNRTGASDGSIMDLKKNGTTVGSIGSYIGSYMYMGSTGGSVDTHIGFVNGTVRPATATGTQLDNTLDLGSSGARWQDIYATNGTIQTSDRNEKQDIAELSDAEQRVAVACKGLLRKFRWKDSVAEKGDEARTHFGIIAQDLQAAFAAEGLDAGDYAMFISTTWTDEETNEEKTRMGVRYSELLAFIIAAI